MFQKKAWNPLPKSSITQFRDSFIFFWNSALFCACQFLIMGSHKKHHSGYLRPCLITKPHFLCGCQLTNQPLDVNKKSTCPPKTGFSNEGVSIRVGWLGKVGCHFWHLKMGYVIRLFQAFSANQSTLTKAPPLIKQGPRYQHFFTPTLVKKRFENLKKYSSTLRGLKLSYFHEFLCFPYISRRKQHLNSSKFS